MAHFARRIVSKRGLGPRKRLYFNIKNVRYLYTFQKPKYSYDSIKNVYKPEKKNKHKKHYKLSRKRY